MKPQFVIIVIAGIVFGFTLSLLLTTPSYQDIKSAYEKEDKADIRTGRHLIYQDDETKVFEVLPINKMGNTYIVTKKLDPVSKQWLLYSVTTK